MQSCELFLKTSNEISPILCYNCSLINRSVFSLYYIEFRLISGPFSLEEVLNAVCFRIVISWLLAVTSARSKSS